jgi:hypothetical protein
MNTGKILASFIVITSIVGGAALYYLQVYAYYDTVQADAPSAGMRLTLLETDQPETILFDNFEGIDADSSPLRFRACFTTPQSQAMLTETYQTMENAIPLTGPKWFSCYDATEVGEAIETGEAIAFLGEKNITDGIDRVIAVFPDGRAFAWHQLNEMFQD